MVAGKDDPKTDLKPRYEIKQFPGVRLNKDHSISKRSLRKLRKWREYERSK